MQKADTEARKDLIPGPRNSQLRFVSFHATMISLLMILAFFTLYGPYPFVRDTLVTTAMSTMNHQWIARFFFTNAQIADSLARNRTGDLGNSNPYKVSGLGETVADNATTLPTSPDDGEHIIKGVGFTRIEGSTYTGWVVRVFDPSRVTMALSESIGSYGEKTSSICERLGAYVGINAGGFSDAGGEGSGGMPIGICIHNGRQISGDTGGSSLHTMIGFDADHRLVLGKFTPAQLDSLQLVNAVEFRPLLIVNGVKASIVGNGGWGTDPRTAIGQTKDGVVIFVIINGRQSGSIGATIRDLQNIMWSYHAYNAANLDGGASSTLVYKNKIINRPSSPYGERYVPNAFLVSYRK